jgi:hypothetical protein
MKKFNSEELINELQDEIRKIIADTKYLKSLDPDLLAQQPAPNKWSVIQVIEHLNSYDRYYLVAIEKSMKKDRPAAKWFRPGLIGDYFTRLMSPGKDGKVANKMQAPKDHRPGNNLEAFPVINSFIEKQEYLIELLEAARNKDLAGIRTPISITNWMKLKLGDTFRFLIAHKQRHFVQIKNTLAAVKGVTGKYSAISAA